MKSLHDTDVSLMEVLPLGEALETAWSTDAHCVSYCVEGEDAWPRLNKPVLKDIIQQGRRVLCSILIFDYDNEDHGPWTQGSLEAFLAKLEELATSGFSLATSWAALYTTRGGARLVYQLEEPISAPEAEARHRGVVSEFKKRGIFLDQSCSDWTRLFRLPKVLRDGSRTWESEFFFLEMQLDNRIPATSLPLLGEIDLKPKYAPEIEFDRPKPSHSEIPELLGKVYHDSKRRLRGRECFGTLFEDRPLASKGARDTTIQSYVGQACAMVFGIEDHSPETVYALFYEAVQKLQPDEQTPDWTEVLWRAVLNYWGREEARARTLKANAKHAEERQKDLLGSIISGMQTWDHSPELRGQRDVAGAYVIERCIAVLKNEYYVLRPDGFYDTISIQKDQIPARIRELQMEDLIPIEQMKGKVLTPRSAQEIITQQGKFFRTLEARFGTEGGTYVSDRFVLPLFRRKTVEELPAEFSPAVHDWLCGVFGKHKVDTILYPWLQWAPAIEQGPLPALFILGPAGIGKKLLAQGLGEVFSAEKVASGRVFGRFREQLLESPVVHVDEGFDDTVDHGSLGTIPDTFRRLVSGDPQSVDLKFRSPVTVYNPYRVLVTANNDRVCQQVAGKRDLSVQDQGALAQRMIVLNAPMSSENWLEARGGLSHTHGWIRSDAGEAGVYTIAKHIQHLYQNRPRTLPTGRFLMGGNAIDAVIKMLSTRSGAAPYVIQAIVAMVEASGAGISGCFVSPTEIMVTCDAIVAHIRNSSFRVGDVDHRRARQVIEAIKLQGMPDGTRLEIRDSGAVAPQSYHRIDPAILYREAEEHGFRCSRLRKICEAKYGASFDALKKGPAL